MRTSFKLLFFSVILFALALLLGFREYTSYAALLLFVLLVGYGFQSFLKAYSRYRHHQSKTTKKR
ncbi:hypothetical protein [Bacillus sp. JCM 19034]|uniref:hypothetical protein n=1 Tax=Bacillus sp. JCM 19034 TaxID=1481928 RepID=UPI0007826FFD|nr:hypothetical protein [Bacillus sp. JCM 19034]